MAADEPHDEGAAFAGIAGLGKTNEQAGGEQLTASSDIYSMGVVVYHMLSGRLPFVVAAEHEVEIG